MDKKCKDSRRSSLQEGEKIFIGRWDISGDAVAKEATMAPSGQFRIGSTIFSAVSDLDMNSTW